MCFESSEARPHLMVSRNVPPNISCLMPIRTERSVVGRLRGRPISALVIDRSGSRYRFVGVAAKDSHSRLDVLSLKQGKWIVAPDLI